VRTARGAAIDFTAMRVIRFLAGPFFILAGTLHFTHTKFYVAIMPDYVPSHREIVYATGVAEIVGGAGLMASTTRRPAGWWLIATLIAVFPANIHMAMHPERYKMPGGRAGLYARLPFQGVFIAWVRSAMSR
jgi:uncharacterized membrane protein